MTGPLYKWLDGNRSMHGGTGRWQKGRWRAVQGPLVPCWNGLHLCREQDLVDWIGPSLWVPEYDGELLPAGNKIVVRRARVVERLSGWNRRTARLFAADCAARAADSAKAAARDAAITAGSAAASAEAAAPHAAAAADAAADAAAWAAADAAVDAAAGAAAWAARAAAWAARAAASTEAAIGDAARAGAWSTRAAVGAVGAGNAERQWQTARLLDYAYGRLT